MSKEWEENRVEQVVKSKWELLKVLWESIFKTVLVRNNFGLDPISRKDLVYRSSEPSWIIKISKWRNLRRGRVSSEFWESDQVAE